MILNLAQLNENWFRYSSSLSRRFLVKLSSSGKGGGVSFFFWAVPTLRLNFTIIKIWARKNLPSIIILSIEKAFHRSSKRVPLAVTARWRVPERHRLCIGQISDRHSVSSRLRDFARNEMKWKVRYIIQILIACNKTKTQ